MPVIKNILKSVKSEKEKEKERKKEHKKFLDDVFQINKVLAECYKFYGEQTGGPFVGVFYVDPRDKSIYADKINITVAFPIHKSSELVISGAKFHQFQWLELENKISGWTINHLSLPRGRVNYRKDLGNFTLAAGPESKPFKKRLLKEFKLEESTVLFDFKDPHYIMQPADKKVLSLK